MLDFAIPFVLIMLIIIGFLLAKFLGGTVGRMIVFSYGAFMLILIAQNMENSNIPFSPYFQLIFGFLAVSYMLLASLKG